jgi:DNA repair protein RecN (Recombination protein N)
LMREIAEGLIDIHGQSEHISLMRVREHLNLLDRFAGLEELREQVAERARQLQAVRRELQHLRQDERARMQRIDLLRFQVQEIRSANLNPDEKAELESELVRLTNAEQLTSLVSGLLTLLEEGQPRSPAVVDLLGQGQRDIAALARIDTSLAPQAQILAEIGYQVEDLARALRDYREKVEFHPRRLAWVEERLSLLRQLERKYGRDLHEVLVYAAQAAAELETLEHSDERIAELAEEESVLLSACTDLCLELSRRRQEVGTRLSAGVETELNDLRMDGTRMGVAFRWRQDGAGLPLPTALPPGITATSTGSEAVAGEPVTRVAFDATGIDTVEFLVAPNVGEGLKPMTRIASGGETARLMLALKTVLSRADRTPTLIFDEIDQGIGGRVGRVVGAKLWQLTAGGYQKGAMRHQVLCITHLPQLAGFGDTHFRVVKQVVGGRTIAQVERVTDEARIAELAQMLGTQGEAARQGAQDILAQAAESKQAAGANHP